jgi:hypothetical protein
MLVCLTMWVFKPIGTHCIPHNVTLKRNIDFKIEEDLYKDDYEINSDYVSNILEDDIVNNLYESNKYDIIFLPLCS